MLETLSRLTTIRPRADQSVIYQRLQTVTLPLDPVAAPATRTAAPRVTKVAVADDDKHVIAELPCHADLGMISIGRGEQGMIRLDDPYVHRLHAVLRWHEYAQTHVVEDLGGANGTYLNEQRLLYPRRLTDGDRLRCGTTTMIYRRMGDRAFLLSEAAGQ